MQHPLEEMKSFKRIIAVHTHRNGLSVLKSRTVKP